MATIYIDQLPNTDRLIYFDWNIFKYLKTPRNNEDEIFRKKIQKLNIPVYYSHAHIKDLTHNYNEEHKKKVSDDLYFLSQITNNNFLWYDFRCNRAEIRLNQPPQFVFDSMINEKSDKDNNEKFTDSYINVLNGFPEVQEAIKNVLDIPVFSSLEETCGEEFSKAMLGARTMGDFMNRLAQKGNDIFSSPDKYKENRQRMTDAIGNEYIVKCYNDLYKTNKKQLSVAQFKDLLQKMNITLPQEVDSRYIELDMMGESTLEKINKKNHPQNLLNDSSHFDCAKFFSYFITEDKRSSEKSKLMIKQLGLDTQVKNIEEFNKLYSP